MYRPTAINILEPLEPRVQFAQVLPTATEQYAVELINRARANPTAETQRYLNYNDNHGHIFTGDLNEGLAAGTISPDPKQPLAINLTLTDSARKHSAWMIANSTFDHYEAGPSGPTPGDRMAAAGYAFSSPENWGENLAINWSSNVLDEYGTATNQHRDLFTDQTISDRGHRTNMMDPTRNEVGVGFAAGLYNYPGYGELNALAQTADSATNGSVFLTGVAYADSVNVDQFYTPGEGLGGITVTAARLSDGQTFSTQTWSSGGYSLSLPAGTYDVVGSGTGLASTIHYNNVAINTQNVKEDFISGQGGGPAEGSIRIRSRTLVVTGTSAADSIGVYVDATNYLVGLNGVSTHYAIGLIDNVAVLAGDGNDRVVIGPGVQHDYVEGGYGKDTLIGAAGADTLYGNASIDRIEGNGGNDLLVGENGNDLIYGGLGNDRIYGGAGNDTIDAGGGNDRVWGGIGDDLIAGGRGRDYLIGERGADTLNGGAHSDYADQDPDDLRIAVEVLI